MGKVKQKKVKVQLKWL